MERHIKIKIGEDTTTITFQPDGEEIAVVNRDACPCTTAIELTKKFSAMFDEVMKVVVE